MLSSSLGVTAPLHRMRKVLVGIIQPAAKFLFGFGFPCSGAGAHGCHLLVSSSSQSASASVADMAGASDLPLDQTHDLGWFAASESGGTEQRSAGGH